MFLLLIVLFCGINCFAKENIVLNDYITNDVEHTFKYPNIEVSSDIKPYSLTLSIENGYFNADNEDLNNDITSFFDFRGGTNVENGYVPMLEGDEDFKVITFNLKNSIDISNGSIKENVIKSIKNFLSNILFHTITDKDAKFILRFSAVPTSEPSVSFAPG